MGFFDSTPKKGFGHGVSPEMADALGQFDVATGVRRKPSGDSEILYPADTPTDNTKRSPMPTYSKSDSKPAESKSDGPESKSESESKPRPRLTIELRATSNGGQVAKVTFDGHDEEFILSPAQFTTFCKLVGSWS